MLDLCSGLGGASAVMKGRNNWDVVRVDVDPVVRPDVCVDIRTFSDSGYYDLVWGSPPCDEFAREAMPWTRTGQDPSLDLVLAVIRIIKEIKPKFWAIENVKGSQKWLIPILGQPTYRSRSHTLWTNIPWVILPKHGHKSILSSRNKRERAMIPFETSMSVAKSVERMNMITQRIWNRDSLTLPAVYIAGFDVQITDPPYSAHVHASAISHWAQPEKGGKGTRKRDLGFGHLSDGARSFVAQAAALVRRWSIAYSDVEESHFLRHDAEASGAEYIRTIPWVRWSMPQLSGDRPPQGFEHVLIFHPPGKKHWNGPGNLIEFRHLALRGGEKHKCEKPLDQALDLVSFFSDVGESVFDPFAGAGTVGLACRLLGRVYAGFEIDPEWATKAQRRLVDPISARDLERVRRWLETDSEPASALPDGPSLIRAQARALDKQIVKAQIERLAA